MGTQVSSCGKSQEKEIRLNAELFNLRSKDQSHQSHLVLPFIRGCSSDGRALA